jgi:hypothetical protein
MAYGTIKVDTITFTDGGVDKSVSVSGLVENPTFTGNVTATGTISGDIVRGQTISGVTVTGTTANFTSGNFTNISGGTHTITSGVFALGTAANPSISFVSDPNTGIYSPGADQVAISTNSSQRLLIDSSGNVGVGTTIASTKLDVAGELTFSAGGAGWRTASLKGIDEGGSFQGSLAFYTHPNAGAGGAPTEKMRLTSAGRLGLGTSTPGAVLESKTANVQSGDAAYAKKAVITNIPYSTSNVTSSALAIYDGTIHAADIGYSYDGTGYYLTFGTNDNTVGAPIESLRIDRSGRVGIGSTGPASRLTIKNPSVTGEQNIFSIEAATSTGTLFSLTANQSDDNTKLFNIVNGPLSFGTNNTERARIDSSGRLLVGTSSSSTDDSLVLQGNSGNRTVGGADVRLRKASLPSADSQGLGTLHFEDNSGNVGARIAGISEGAWTSGSNHRSRLVFSTCPDSGSSPVERMRITQNGTVLIGITTSYSGNGITLSPTGSTTIRNQTTGTQEAFGVSTGTYDPAFFVKGNGGINNYSANNVNLSDRNAKKDITPAADTWNCLKEWEIVNYRYKDQPADADLSLGVIAQQVAQNCPEVITIFQEAKEATEDAPAQEERLGVKEQQMYWMAIKALQEAQLRIETLEAKVAALEGV